MQKAVLVLVLSVVIAGCMGATNNSDPDLQAAQSTGATDAGATQDGEVRGYVLDDERVPVANATIVLLVQQRETLSASDGTFVLTGVPPGKQVIEAHAPGLASESRAIVVQAGTSVQLEFVLSPLPVQAPHFLVREHRVTLGAGVGTVSGQCQGCRWSVDFPAGPDYLLVEIFGKHTISNPVQKDAVSISIGKIIDHGGRRLNGSAFKECRPELTGQNCGDLPLRIVLNKPTLLQAGPRDALPVGVWLSVGCDPRWICFEETYRVYVTAFYWWHPRIVEDSFSASQPPTAECATEGCARGPASGAPSSPPESSAPTFPIGRAEPLRLVSEAPANVRSGAGMAHVAAWSVLTGVVLVAVAVAWTRRSGRSTGILAAARLAFTSHDLARAERLAQQALRHDAANVEAWFLFGGILLARGEHGRAVTELEHAMRRFGSQMSGLAFVLSLAYDRKGEPEKASSLLPVVAREKALWERLHHETQYRILVPPNRRPPRPHAENDPSYG